ncbi:hypothetical protein [Lentzea sp. CA-135723]|uniref:hypothetical protein n=1 Tax=Lentzea sp. CA-135723 TaxID=3239950 RepID=UPI003D8BF7A4
MREPLPGPPVGSDDDARAEEAGVETDEGVRRERRLAWNEDWAATIVGLVLLALVLTQFVPGWLVP